LTTLLPVDDPKQVAKTVEKPIAAQPTLSPSERLRDWQGMAEGVYSANTLRAQKCQPARNTDHRSASNFDQGTTVI